MTRIAQLFVLFFLAFPLSGCRIGGESVRVGVISGPLRISAEIAPQAREFGEGKIAVFGHVTVTNVSDGSAAFGNSCLMLAIAPEQDSRAYKDTVASEVVDFMLVPIEAGESLSERVYWVFDSVPSAPDVGLSYTCGYVK